MDQQLRLREGDREKGRRELQALVDGYPQSDEAIIARARLDSLQ